MRHARPLQRSMLACLIAAALIAPAGAASTKEEGHQGRSFDARTLVDTPQQRPAVGAQAAAINALRSRVPDLGVQIDVVTGVTRSLLNNVGYLTGANPGVDNKSVALGFVQQNAALLGLTPADLAEYEITDDVESKASPVRHLYLRQTHQGLPVYNGQLQVHVDREGRILSVNNAFLPNLAQSVNRLQPGLTVDEAVAAAAAHLGRAVGPIVRVSAETDARRRTVLEARSLSERPIDAALMLLPIAQGEARLVWNFQIWEPRGGDIADFTVDAETGKVWTRRSWVDDAQYKVYPAPVESPQHTAPLPPADGRVTVVDPHAPGASPFGWHDTNGVAGAESTRTVGNNVHAYTDIDDNNAPDAGSDPDCGAPLDCTFALDLTQAPSTYRPAAVANLFYFNNIMHDVAYPFGFDEMGGNFQVNNYGNGGTGNDSVQAEAQDGGGTNNANFGTPPDGSRPRMQMFLWTAPNPDRDGDFDNGIIAHEYGHGISNRLVGGPANVSCLDNSQQAGEGLSDWWALYYTQPDATTRHRGIGTYALNQPVSGQGIRTDYYDGDPAVNAEPQENTWTYASISGQAIPHGVGSRWAQAYWQVTWALIDEHGYDADLDNYTGTAADKGNIRAMYYIIEGLKNSACDPTFVDIRNGIIAAANAAPFNGEDTCRIWEAFAEFGLGEDAVSGGSNSTSPTDGFSIPNSCSFLGATPETLSICAGTPAIFPVTLGAAFTPPVVMSVTGNPPGTTAVFATNPVVAVPGASSLSIGNTAGAAAGSYNLTVNADYVPGPTATMPLTLNVFDAVPTTPALTAPANSAIDVSVSPTLTWNAATQGEDYTLEVATDNAFTNIVYTQNVTGTSHAVGTPLSGSTQYFWRVRSSNTCGDGANSPTFSFTTQAFFCASPNLAIPDNAPAGVTADLVVANGGVITDLNVSLNVTHTWVGDLIFKLRHVETGTEVTFVDRPGAPASTNGCSGNNIDATLDDEAGAPVETQCAGAAPTINGTFQPNNPLSAFDGISRAGTWRLTASDNAGADLGTVNSFCISGTAELLSEEILVDGFE